jgi:hypothetical protein
VEISQGGIVTFSPEIYNFFPISIKNYEFNIYVRDLKLFDQKQEAGT